MQTEGTTKIAYIAFRMAPMLLISFFMLTSIINVDLKGVVYICGLVIALAATLSINTTLTRTKFDGINAPAEACKVFRLGTNGDVLSTIPLGVVVYAYTFFYLLIFIANLSNTANDRGVFGHIDKTTLNAMMAQNIPILVIFPSLILLESVWLMSYKCIEHTHPILAITIAVFIGSLVGVLWALLITYTRRIELQYVNKYGMSVCNRPTKMMLKCTPKTT